MTKGEKLTEEIGKLLYNKYGNMVFPENIYDYLQSMPDEKFDEMINLVNNQRCVICEEEKRLECCRDCYDDMRGEMLTRDEYS